MNRLSDFSETLRLLTEVEEKTSKRIQNVQTGIDDRAPDEADSETSSGKLAGLVEAFSKKLTEVTKALQTKLKVAKTAFDANKHNEGQFAASDEDDAAADEYKSDRTSGQAFDDKHRGTSFGAGGVDDDQVKIGLGSKSTDDTMSGSGAVTNIGGKSVMRGRTSGSISTGHGVKDQSGMTPTQTAAALSRGGGASPATGRAIRTGRRAKLDDTWKTEDTPPATGRK